MVIYKKKYKQISLGLISFDFNLNKLCSNSLKLIILSLSKTNPEGSIISVQLWAEIIESSGHLLP